MLFVTKQRFTHVDIHVFKLSHTAAKTNNTKPISYKIANFSMSYFRINADEYAQLLGNFVEVVEAHEELLASMETSNDRIGKLFLTKAATMKCIHQAYCAAHPRAIVILDKYSEPLEAYMERQGAASPGLLVLTTGLSKPFRRLDKYAAMLQELERHMESGHPDRGDTQRSISIYKDIAVS